ncbi:tetratricopeptide repeat protein [Bradyrhizobium sp. HKCCYLRH2060]|uniref:tetratricopeptide repeat protein n=1 Tax=Bradyrhizobium TaxID=374 RepID=UPI002915C91B|nr:alpha/beta fold hydrolase [Bradyrhizobium sp. SZCCHNR3003]
MSRLIRVAGWEGGTQVNVVFVHGLGGHPYDTWRQSAESDTFWPAWLASEIPGLATWTLAYDAPLTNWLGTAMPIQDRANNVLECLLGQHDLRDFPLVFVCHSLGGLVVKQLLRAADGRRAYDQEAKSFLDSVKGVVFIATPHSGSIQATLLEKLRLAAWPSDSAVDLVKNNPNLRDLNVWYRNNSADIRHKVFYEKQGTAIGIIVAPSSSDPGLLHVDPVAIDADHLQICKPVDRSDLVYIRTKDFIEDTIKSGDLSKIYGLFRACDLPQLPPARPPTLVPIAIRLATLLIVGLIILRGLFPSYLLGHAIFGQIGTIMTAAFVLLLILYNAWIWRTRTPPIGIKRRLVIHFLSGLVLIATSGTTAILVSDRYAARMLPSLLCRRSEGPSFAQTAISRLERYTTGDGSRDLAARLDLATCYDRAGRTSDYVDTLDKLLSDPASLSILGPTEYGSHATLLGLTLLSEEFYYSPSNRSKAIRYLRAGRRYFPGSPFPLLYLGFAVSDETKGRSSEQQQEIAEIFAEAQQLLQQPPFSQNPVHIREYHYWYGRSLARIDKPNDASRELNAALEGEQREDRRDHLFFYLGQIELLDRHDREAALKWWRQMKSRERLAEAASNSAMSLFIDSEGSEDKAHQTELLGQADQMLISAQTLGIPAPEFHEMAGLIAMGRDQYREAMIQFGALVEARPFHAIAYYLLGKAAHSAKSYAEARTALSKAIELDPTNNEAKYLLGQSLVHLNEWDKAGSMLSEAVVGAPENPSYLWALLAWRDLQAKSEFEKDPDVSENSFIEALKLSERTIRAAEKADNAGLAKLARRERAEIWNSLAYSYMSRGQALTMAMKYIDQALEGWPKDGMFLSTKAEILTKRAEREPAESPQREANLTQAETLLNSALSDKTITYELAAACWVDLGRVEKLRGNRDAANKNFLRALELDPTNANAKKLAD